MAENNITDEIVYVLTNEAMPGYVKVGITKSNLEKRIKELGSSTSVPLPFTAFYACTVENAAFVEHQLHDAFDGNRVNPHREFFYIAPERIVAALKLRELKEVTPKQELVETKEDQVALNEARKRRNRFNFETAKLPVGSELYFSRDENITAKVVNSHSAKSIEFRGEITSLSLSAQKVLKLNYPVSGTEYWMFDGETLDERRQRFESGE